jgi:hypothetical protein
MKVTQVASNKRKPGSAFPNCEAQGNVMIIQDENIHPSIPSDSRNGGCLDFTFTQRGGVVNLGIMDIDGSDNVDITITTDEEVELETFESPANIGDNGHWIANKTTDLMKFNNIKKMQGCFPGSGVLIFIHFEACNSAAMAAE